MIIKIFLYFIIYSFLGWSIEVIDKFIEHKRFINRGFLIGPLCPIYGFGTLFILLLIGNNTSDILSVFLKSIFICSILEYFTSYILEKVYNAKWWDYSRKRFNLNGRICLETMIPFGILGSLVVYFINPFIVFIVDLIPIKLLYIIFTIILTLFILDLILSSIVTYKIKGKINSNKDETEYIRKEVINFITSHSFLYKCLKKHKLG